LEWVAIAFERQYWNGIINDSAQPNGIAMPARHNILGFQGHDPDKRGCFGGFGQCDPL
jgi:hypothetical protein